VCTDQYSNHVTAIISPNRRALLELGPKLHSAHSATQTFEQLCEDPAVVEYILRNIRHLGTELNLHKMEIPVAITLVKEEWSQDNSLLTAAMKMKRREVNEFYKKEIAQMFQKTKSIE